MLEELPRLEELLIPSLDWLCDETLDPESLLDDSVMLEELPRLDELAELVPRLN